MKPENIGYLTELDEIYARELKEVFTAEEFEQFIQKWQYWLDDDCKNLTAKDWETLKPLIADCRKEIDDIDPEKHKIAINMVLPERIFKVTDIALEFKVPWGCAYFRTREAKMIDY